jgi:hypothetical protein
MNGNQPITTTANANIAPAYGNPFMFTKTSALIASPLKAQTVDITHDVTKYFIIIHLLPNLSQPSDNSAKDS